MRPLPPLLPLPLPLPLLRLQMPPPMGMMPPPGMMPPGVSTGRLLGVAAPDCRSVARLLLHARCLVPLQRCTAHVIAHHC
jgi:hypothetical protein